MEKAYNKDKALIKAQKEYPHYFKKTTMTGMTPREKRNEKYMDRLQKIRDMRYRDLMTLEEIGHSLHPKITRQAVRDILKNHFPLEQLIDVAGSRKNRNRKLRIEKGDRVWFLMPHNGMVEKVHEDGSFTIKPDSVGEDVSIGRFGKDEVSKL